MGKSRPRFRRKPPVLSYRTVFVISTEGDKYDPEYLDKLARHSKKITLTVLPSKKESAPLKVLKKAKEWIKANKPLQKDDEIWLVLDRDNWTETDLEIVLKQCQKLKIYLAVSNPCFEYWLLLHFVEIKPLKSIGTCRNCKDRLKGYLPLYTFGNLEFAKVKPKIPEAISRAEAQDNPPCNDWPKTNGTTLYRLVKKLVETDGKILT